MLRSTITIFAAAFVAMSAPASAIPVIGGATRIDFNQNFLDSGLLIELTGNATESGVPGGSNLPITGGNLDTNLAGTIRHDGSGIALSDSFSVLTLSNFVIDTTASTVFGDVSQNGIDLGAGVALFTFDLGSVTVAELTDISNPALVLNLTQSGASSFETAFGFGFTLIGQPVAVAATTPLFGAVPEPGTWAMMIVGFGLAGTRMRARNRRAAITA